MSLRLHGTADPAERRPDIVATPASPQAVRQRRARWQDPKLWFGVVLVLISVVVGARLFAAADDTVAVWQLVRDVPSGSPMSASDVQLTEVHFDDPSVAGQYLGADQIVEPTLRATRDLRGGELLARSSVTSSAAPATREVPLGVAAAHAPADLHAGDHVQVWAVPDGQGSGAGRPAGPSMVLGDVTVLSVGGGVIGVSAERQVLVSVGPRTDVGAVLRQIVNASVVLVRMAG